METLNATATSFLLTDVVSGRDPQNKELDKSALQAIAQAAVNVELFTIPLYMTSLYSLQGMHEINGKNNFYQGRIWPGMSTKANPTNDNEKAFNAIFSVFIAEMLHLQLASNICKAVGAIPDFTSPALQSENYGWTCYARDCTVIPHIIDFRDTIAPYDAIRVKLDAVNEEQINLFLAIEETEAKAKSIIQPDKMDKYFPTVPFENWKMGDTEADLPLFGSIGAMYLSMWEYLSIRYSDNTTLWDYVFEGGNLIQQNIFNSSDGGMQPEYPGIDGVIDPATAVPPQLQVLNMINAITDQGEGAGVVPEIMGRLGKHTLQAVQAQFQPSDAAMKNNYPSYTATGAQAPSRDAAARSSFGAMDHYETFEYVMGLVKSGTILTWDQWFAQGNSWTADKLKTDSYDLNKYDLPKAEDIAGALNRLRNDKDGSNYTMLSHAAAGAIAGVTTVLNTFWNTTGGTFPFPSMAGSGDRMSICWAIFGKAPDLSVGLKPREKGILYHSCQGLNLDPSQPNDPASCAALEVFHSCRGSNSCKGEGGCGFVQSVNGGGGGCSSKVSATFRENNCGNPSASLLSAGKVEGTCGLPNYLSAPSDNKCGTLGGCAVPISASQIFPAPPDNSTMELFDFVGPDFTSTAFSTLNYSEGELVYDVAWKAYCEVLQHRGDKVPAEKPAPSDIRLAFPPST